MPGVLIQAGLCGAYFYHEEYTLEGFPDISKVVQQLKQTASGHFEGHATYTICVSFPDGSLVIPEVAVHLWKKNPFEDKALAIKSKHDEVFNKLKHKAENVSGQQPAKKNKETKDVAELNSLEEADIKTLDDFTKQITDGERLSISDGAEFLSSGDEGKLWVSSSARLLGYPSRSCVVKRS